MDYPGLNKSFQDRYFNKIEIGFRLPGELFLPEVWEKIQAEKQKNAEILPLIDDKRAPGLDGICVATDDERIRAG